MRNEHIGKFLVVNEGNERIFVIGDLHLGYEASLREAGMLVVEHLFDELTEELNEALKKAGRIDRFVLLGDIKHAFGSISSFEREQLSQIISALKEKSSKITVTKGNHDALLDYMRNSDIEIKDYCIFGRTAFMHGDKDFKEAWNDNVDQIIIGHLHPAVTIEDGVKREKYKCFLAGKIKGKSIVIVPSATGKNSGTDPRMHEIDIPWKANIGNFDVTVVGDDGKNYEFGKLKDI